MDFFGIGIGEIAFIVILGFIVLGPERVQNASRTLGRMVAQVLAWQQQSPEAQMVQQVRKDFEREIIDLKNEMIRTRRELDVSSEVRQLQQQTSSILQKKEQSPSPTPATPPAAAGEHAVSHVELAQGGAAEGEDALLNHLLREEEERRPSERKTVPHRAQSRAARNGQMPHDATPPPEPSEVPRQPAANGQAAAINGSSDHTTSTSTEAAPPSIAPISHTLLSEHERLSEQIQALMTDLHALQEQLQARGVLDPEWQPVSSPVSRNTPSP